MSDTTLKPCPFCGAAAAYTEHEKTNETRGCCPRGCGAEGPFGARSLGPGWGDAMARDGWNSRPIEDALRARAEAAEAAAAAAGPITVCDCGVGGPRLVDEDGLCVSCGCDVVVVADRHSADIVAQLRQEREAAEAALATARAEGAAADALLSDGLEIVESLSGGYDVWCDAVRRRLTGGPVEGA